MPGEPGGIETSEQRNGASPAGAPLPLIAGLTLLSGGCALAYEVLYLRSLTTLFGDMYYVHAALLATFLVGVGSGARWAWRLQSRLWLLEIATGLWALALPLVLRFLADSALLVPVTGSPAATVFATMVLIAIPAVLVGCSLPIFSAYLKAVGAGGEAFARIYVLYNLGALASVLAVELLLIRAWGVSATLAVLGATNIGIGLVLRFSGAGPSPGPPPPRRRFPRRIEAALVLASGASAVFQMFFLKASDLVFEPHRENFALALALVLLGIWVGTWWGVRSSWRVASVLVGAPVAIAVAGLAWVPLVRAFQETAPAWRGSEAGILAHKLLAGAVFGLPTFLLFGSLVPLLMRGESEVAGESGRLLWLASLANAGGYLSFVLVLHPLLPADGVLLVAAATSLVASRLAAPGGWTPRERIGVACAVALLAVLPPTWDDDRFYLAHWLRELDGRAEITTWKSGAESATLHREKRAEWISYNGKPSIHARINDVVAVPEMVSGVIPAILAPRLERALVLGHGTGITAGSAARVFETTDVVEINAAFYDMIPSLRRVNLGIESNPGALLHLADGRSFLAGRTGRWDAIVNSIPAPTYTSASKIYTVEFFRRAREALRDGGVFSTWLSPRYMSEEGVEMILSGLARVFEHCDLRLLQGSYYFSTCSDRPLAARSFDELPVEPILRRELENGFEGFVLAEAFEDQVLSPDLFAQWRPTAARENTDDHPVLEFELVRRHQLRRMGGDPFVADPDRFGIDPLRGAEGLEPARLARRARFYRRWGIRWYLDVLKPAIEGDPELAAAWKELESRPFGAPTAARSTARTGSSRTPPPGPGAATPRSRGSSSSR